MLNEKVSGSRGPELGGGGEQEWGLGLDRLVVR